MGRKQLYWYFKGQTDEISHEIMAKNGKPYERN